LLEVSELTKHFPVQKSFLEKLLAREMSYVHAVDGVSFGIDRGEILGLVGESGSGKTTTGRLILGLEKPTSGSIFYDGIDLVTLEGEALRRFRRRIQVVFQDPYASLNPRMRIGDAVAHPARIHGLAGGDAAKKLVFDVFEKVGLSPASTFYVKYPHQLSGGQRQRVAIARALILNPEFIVADEPIAMVDVSVRALILELLLKLKEEYNLTYLFITHDLATAKYVCDAIAIMYLGQIVEAGESKEIFRNPLHPYTIALMSAIPVPDPKARREKIIPRGEIPSAVNPPAGCRFHPRCPFVMEICWRVEPKLVEASPGHLVSCHLVN
jgi:peptide/nickel transport system ATP-binding protein